MDQKDLNKVEAQKNKKQKGASLVEYALLVALIAVICIVAVKAIGQKASATFSNVATQLGSASN
ncbi:MAG: Flp family type IVb pilin [Deltaproteobacteria bacterium]|nr:Flp family type IVb pilin [Deltaproteobacteria bacterium]